MRHRSTPTAVSPTGLVSAATTPKNTATGGRRMTQPHNHALDGHVHDECPNCDLIKERSKRDKAHKEVHNALETIRRQAELRYPKK